MADTTSVPAPAVTRGTGTERDDAGGGAAASTRWRRTGFRVLAVVLALWMLALHVFGLTEVVLMWLPADTVLSAVGGDGEGLPSLALHRSHFMAVGILSWAVMLPMLAQLRRPERRVGSMRLLGVLAVASVVLFGLSGTFGEWLFEEWTWVLPVVVLGLLHPRAGDLVRRTSHDRRQLVLAGVAALPWAWYAAANARLQLANAVGDEHAALEHWAITALLGIIVVAAAVIGAGRVDGWQLPAWIAGCSSILFGMHSLVFPGPASSLPTVAAVAAIAWGVLYLGATVQRARGEAAGNDRDVAPAATIAA